VLITSIASDETNRVSRPRRSSAAVCRAGGWSAIQPDLQRPHWWTG